MRSWEVLDLMYGSQANTGPTIVWVDDNREQLRHTMESIGLEFSQAVPQDELFKPVISVYLKEPEFRILGMQPLEEMDEYLELFVSERVAALVADQRLREQAISPGSNMHVTYDGHDLICHIRASQRRMPLYVVTAYPDEQALSDTRGEYEFAVDRQDFNDSPRKTLQPILRAAAEFIETHEARLEELTRIARKVAAGTNTSSDLERLRAIEASLGIDYPVVNTVVADHLETLEQKLDDLESILETLGAALGGSGVDE